MTSFLHREGDVLHLRYQIIRPLKSGGMSSVYLAVDRQTGKRVVVKHPIYDSDHGNNSVMLERLQIEAEILKHLNHPYIPRFFGSWGTGWDFHIVTEYIAAKSMRDSFRNDPAPLRETIEYMLELLEVLEYLHSKGVIHRDVKPTNLLMGDNIALIDFGAAEASFLGSKHHGAKIGTPGYQCPELFRGILRPQCDIYSAGATMLFLLSGKQPSPVALEIAPLPDVLAQIARKAMNAYPTDRYSTAWEMKRALTNADHDPKPARIVLRDRCYELDQETTTIGRGQESSIWIDDPERFTSPVHAEIHKEGGGKFCIVDKSLNGTYIYENETYKRIQRWQLRDGDIIVLCHNPDRGPHKILKFRGC
jgi:serine/threonine protein kinase